MQSHFPRNGYICGLGEPRKVRRVEEPTDSPRRVGDSDSFRTRWVNSLSRLAMYKQKAASPRLVSPRLDSTRLVLISACEEEQPPSPSGSNRASMTPMGSSWIYQLAVPSIPPLYVWDHDIPPHFRCFWPWQNEKHHHATTTVSPIETYSGFFWSPRRDI